MIRNAKIASSYMPNSLLSLIDNHQDLIDDFLFSLPFLPDPDKLAINKQVINEDHL